MWSRQSFLSSGFFCGNLFFFGAQLGLIGESVHACQIQNVAFWGGSFEKNRVYKNSLKKSKNNYSKGVVYNPWEVRSPLEILSRTGQKTPARGLLTTLWNWESFEVHLEFCQQAKAACILAFAPSTDDIQDGKRRYQAQLQFLKFLAPDWCKDKGPAYQHCIVGQLRQPAQDENTLAYIIHGNIFCT